MGSWPGWRLLIQWGRWIYGAEPDQRGGVAVARRLRPLRLSLSRRRYKTAAPDYRIWPNARGSSARPLPSGMAERAAAAQPHHDPCNAAAKAALWDDDGQHGTARQLLFLGYPNPDPVVESVPCPPPPPPADVPQSIPARFLLC
ncbi:hypothetical protein BS78_05G081500 [Paspalum vaginatum]|nr:hypothetical protein BS78_05G081500 [Paspalum vaginatum]